MRGYTPPKSPRTQLSEDLAGLGEPAEGLLGKDEITVRPHFEDAAVRRHKLAVSPELVLQFVRQTGGTRFVVSLAAVLDPYFHRPPPGEALILASGPGGTNRTGGPAW